MPLKHYKRAGSPFYYVRGTVCGRRVNQTSRIPHSKKAAIKEFTAKLESAIVKRSLDGLGETVSFAQAALRYKGEVSYKDQLFVEKLEGYFTGKMLHDIGQREIDAAAETLYPGCKPQTRNRHVYTPMSAIMRRAAQDGYIRWGGLRRPKSREMLRERWCTPDEAERFLKHADHDLAGLFVFLLYTGVRISEALGLDWADVDLEQRHITLREFKTRRRRAVALVSGPFDVLATMSHREGFVFPWRDRKQVYRLWRPCCLAAALKDLKPHDMRHTYATWLRKYSGADLRQIMEWGGWRDVKSVLRYSHVSSEELYDAVQKMPQITRNVK